MRRENKMIRQAGWMLLPILTVFCMLMFQATAAQAAGKIITSSDRLWQYELKEEQGGQAAAIDEYNGSDRDLVIPETIDGYEVKYIGSPGGWRSVKMDRFDSITIPDSVKGLSNVPFFIHSRNLNFLSLGKNYGTYSQHGRDINMIKSADTYDIKAREYRVSPDNALLTAVDGVLYSKDMTVLKLYPALKDDTAYTVPDGVVSIDNDAMNGLQYLERLVLPDGLKTIGTYCCKESSIRSVRLPDSLTKLDHGIFNNSKLQSVDLPDTITEIGGYVFTGTPLEEVIIPDTVKSLGAGDFMDCSRLKRIRIGSGVASIGGNCFYGLTALETLEISEENQNFKSEEGMLLTKDGSTLIQYAAAGNTEFILPKGVSVIGPKACYGMPFRKITVPDTVVSIGDNAFENCTKAETACIPASVEKFGSSVFSGCTSLKTAAIDARDAKIGPTFNNCNMLTEVTLPETAASVQDTIFFGKSLRSVYLKAPKAPSISYATYIQGEDAQTELIKKSSGVRIFVPERAEGYDKLPWSRMHIVYGNAVTAERLVLNPSSMILHIGDTASIQASVSPEDATVQDISWETSDETVISVDQGGKVSALSAGTAMVRATAGGLSAECTVTVSGSQETRKFRLETSGGTASSNYNVQNYTKWSKPVKSYLFADSEGCLTRVEFINGKLIHETYGMDGVMKKSGSIPDELPLAGGFYASREFRFVVYGQTNSAKSDSTEIMRIVKYDKGWNRVASCSLYGENTIKPFDAGSLRFAEYGNTLYIRTSHTMYDGHQANLQAAVDMASMKITDKFSGVANVGHGGYVSHSFNQFLLMDGEDLIALDHGDSYPRAAVLVKYPGIKSTTYARASIEYVNALRFPGQIGNNSTGASLGGLEKSEQHYIFAGNYANNSGSSVRNIFVNITGKDFLKNQDASMIYLTSFDAGSSVTVSTPQLVKINDKTFLVLWNETDTAGITVHSQMIDENGNKVSKEQSFHGSLSDCQPIVQNGQAVWYYTGTEKGDTLPVFCRVSVDGWETVDNLPAREDTKPEDTKPENTNPEDASGKSKEISAVNISLSRTSYTYDGKSKMPAVTVRDGNKILKKDIDYTVTYSNNVNVGTASVTVTGKGDYSGTVTKAFSITKDSSLDQNDPGVPGQTGQENPSVPEQDGRELSKCTVTISQTSFTYDGKAKMPSVTVRDGDTVLEEGTDYTVVYRNNINIGTAETVITGKGDYKGVVEKSFDILLKTGKVYKAGIYKYKLTGTSTVSMAGTVDKKAAKIVCPETVEIGGKVFMVTAVAGNAFKNHKKITNVKIGKNVTSIGASAFKNCRKLGNITIKSSGLKKVGKNALNGIKSTAKIKVPKKKLTDYKKLFRNKGQGKKVKIVRQG